MLYPLSYGGKYWILATRENCGSSVYPGKCVWQVEALRGPSFGPSVPGQGSDQPSRTAVDGASQSGMLGYRKRVGIGSRRTNWGARSA